MLLPFSTRAKAWEPKALALRKLANVAPRDLLDPWVLAIRVRLRVFDPADALRSLTAAERTHLLSDSMWDWSGGVYPKPLPDGTRICILNPKHSRRRNKITLMEEITHVHLNHTPSGLVLVADGVQVRDYNHAQEAEAYGIGAAALLPWQTFFPAINAGRTIEEIAEQYEVTTELVEYRVKITGAYRLYQARQRRNLAS